MTRWLETDSLSNQDISSALAIGAYTADADRLILVQFMADQIAGNGDYVFYVTLRINGAGSSYQLVPTTTATVASGVTAIGGQSAMIAVRSGDVLTVYLDGLAGDNSTPDTTVRWFELAALRPTTADRTLDVSSGGEAGVDWANVGGATTTVNLSGTTVKTATDVETDTADIQARIGTAGAGLTALPWNAAWDAEVQSEAADALNAYDPPTKAELDAGLAALSDLDAAGIRAAVGLADANLDTQMDALPTAAETASQVRTELTTELGRIDVAVSTRLATAGYTAPPSAPTVADAVWDEALSGHATAGTAGAALAAAGAAGDPWAMDVTDGSYPDPDTAGYIVASLAGIDVSAVTQVPASSAGHLTITVGLTFDEAVTGLTIPVDWVAALWTLKNNARDADTAALVQLRATNPAAGTDGLQRLNGAALVAPITAADGDLTVTQASGRIDVWLSDEMTAMLGAATAIGWDVKFIDAAGDSTGRRGTADVVLTETKSTV